MCRFLTFLFTILFFVNTLASITKNGSIINYPFLSKPQGSNTSVVSIRKDERGFFVEADFIYDGPEEAGDQQKAYPVLLGLYTSQTLLASTCSKFSHYDCDSFSCYPFDETAISYPYFTAKGVYATALAYVDYSRWRLSSDAILADSCGPEGVSFGSGAYGILGMGIDGDSDYNFIGSSVFSIYLKEDLLSGLLIFKKDMSYATSSIPVAVILTDKNWQAQMNGKIQIEQYEYSISSKLIFDINADAIGFPSDQYFTILENLSNFGVFCKGDTSSRPNCDYNGNISDLPNINLINGTVRIPIAPQIYVQDGGNTENVTSIVLDMRAIGTNYSEKAFVTDDFSNTIILDAKFMSYYYTVFEGATNKTSDKVTIYYTDYSPHNPPKDYTWIYVLIAVTIIMILGFVFRHFCSGKKIPSKNTSPEKSPLIHSGEHNIPVIVEETIPVIIERSEYSESQNSSCK